MNNIEQEQQNLSERPNTPHHSACADGNRRSHDRHAHRDLRLLNTIAGALTTGNPGELFAAAFDKHGQMQLVLAKNGSLTPDDIAAANEFISLIENLHPASSNPVQLLPFLIRRCGPNINKQIRKLHMSLLEMQNDLTLALEKYEPTADIAAEFRYEFLRALLGKYEQVSPPFAKKMWTDFIETISNLTAEALNPGNISSATQKYERIYLIAGVLRYSRFMQSLVEDHHSSNGSCNERAEQLNRHLDEVCQYFNDIRYLISAAKRVIPISHRWVTDIFSSSGQCLFDSLRNIAYNSMDQVVSRGLNYLPFPPQFVVILSMLDSWESYRKEHSCLHAELCIILHFGLPLGEEYLVHPIGVSKQSCQCCISWMNWHNDLFETEWTTSISHG